ncbi:MAG: hypothetical protein RL367_103 [Pseudomonadota bacterium]|jgi:hypothetical protein
MEKIFGFVTIAIDDGATERFVAHARTCHEAALPVVTGTQAYENAAAMATHLANAGAHMAEILRIARCETALYGAVPPALLQRPSCTE